MNKFGPFVLASVFAMLLGACGGGGQDPVATATPTQTSTVEPTQTSTVEPTQPSPTSTPTSIPDNHIRIGAVGIEARVVAQEITEDFQIPEPPDNDTIELIDFTTLYPQLGGVPGEGNAVLYGNYDSGLAPCSNGKEPPPCYAVMGNLQKVKLGDQVELRWKEQTHTYSVGAVCNVPVDQLPGEVFERTTQERLTLYALGGDFNQETGSYPSFLVVIAEKTGASVSCPPGTFDGPPVVTKTTKDK